ncbi:hypothetical protein [Verrucomicrobium spinosum]|uniref:hypothetical protein n=1 Tax=Verrucomicrobium spinosum TaxID=2736 RepID=UPI0009464B9C|nr:hypothetical protein [Verrucomicrobium spinosum]
MDVLDAEGATLDISRLRVLLAIGALESYMHDLNVESQKLGVGPLFQVGVTMDDILQQFRSKMASSQSDNLAQLLVRYYLAVRNEAAHPFDSNQHLGKYGPQRMPSDHLIWVSYWRSNMVWTICLIAQRN